MVPKIYLDDTGLHVPDYPAVWEGLMDEIRRIYGEDVYLEPDSQDGQLLAVFAQAYYDVGAAALAVYNSFAPGTAQGVGLSRQVKINGLRRMDDSHSTADARLVGQAGTVISGGAVQDVNGEYWDLPPSVVIPEAGEITVTATARNAGNIRAAAGAINTIAAPTRGWQAVSNPADATPGRAVETDAQLRARQKQSTALPSLSIFDGLLGAVASLDGVTRLRGYENDSGATDARGLPPHSITVVVEGGDAQAIADTINAKKAPGCYTHGTTAISVTDVKNVPNTIRFYRPTVVPLEIVVQLAPLPGYLATTGEDVKAALAAYVNSQRIGDVLYFAKLFVPANLSNQDTGGTYDLTALAVARKGQTPAAANIDVRPFEVVSVAPDDIRIVTPSGGGDTHA